MALIQRELKRDKLVAGTLPACAESNFKTTQSRVTTKSAWSSPRSAASQPMQINVSAIGAITGARGTFQHLGWLAQRIREM
jgi:hypothetical protein